MAQVVSLVPDRWREKKKMNYDNPNLNPNPSPCLWLSVGGLVRDNRCAIHVLGSMIRGIKLNPAHIWHICGILKTATSTQCRKQPAPVPMAKDHIDRVKAHSTELRAFEN
jgi:hypothetical protein